MDATQPTDSSLGTTFASLLREVRAGFNTLTATVTQHVTGFPVYVPVEVTTASHAILAVETFIKGNAGVQSQIFTVDPTVLTPGIQYVLKKTDATANTVTLRAATDTFINDTEAEVVATLQYEVLRFISDGVGIQTC